MSYPIAIDVLLSSRIDDLRAEAKHDRLVALVGSAGARKSPMAPFASFLGSVWSQMFSWRQAAAAANL